MTRYLAVLLALVGLAVPITAAASHGNGNGGGPNDFAAGAGRIASPGQFFNVSAQDGPKGPKGNMTLDRGATRLNADVNCLVVNGNQATVQGTVRKSNDPLAPEGSQITFFVEDNGEPGKDNDRFVSHLVPLCGSPLAQLQAQTLETGNVVVHDAG